MRSRSSFWSADRGPGRGQPAVHPRSGKDTGPRARRPPPHPAGRRRRGQGLLIPRQPRPPAETPHRSSDPGEAGRGRQPEEEGLQRRPARQPRRRLHKERNTVERLINTLKAWRGIGEVDSGRFSDVTTSRFPRAASRTRRARLRAPVSAEKSKGTAPGGSSELSGKSTSMGAVSSRTSRSIRSGNFSAKPHPILGPVEWPISVKRFRARAAANASRSSHPNSKE